MFHPRKQTTALQTRDKHKAIAHPWNHFFVSGHYLISFRCMHVFASPAGATALFLSLMAPVRLNLKDTQKDLTKTKFLSSAIEDGPVYPSDWIKHVVQS
jgi:hypothetical protein